MTSLAIALAYAGINFVPGPAQILSESISHYYTLGNLSGTIETTITAGNQKETCKTTIQISSPDRIYLDQTWPKSPNLSMKTISNGTHFVYPVPNTVGENALKRAYLVESMTDVGGDLTDYRGVYSVSSGMLTDRSIPLDIMIGRDSDLQTINKLLSNYSDGGTRDYNGEEVNVVFCDVKLSLGSEFKYKGAFFINKDRDIRYFKVYGVLVDDNNRKVETSTEWVVKVKVNDKSAIDTKLYNLDLVNR